MNYSILEPSYNTNLGGGIADHRTCCFIASDYYRLKGSIPNFSDVLKLYLKNEIFRYLVCFRLLSSSKCLIPKCYLKITKKVIGARRHLQIPQAVKIGYGIDLVHGIDIVINPTTVIGNNCNLSQFLNIGTNKGQAAIIGDNVYIGPHVCLVENLNIGNNAVIGAGSVVTRNVPPNSTVAGNPAKVLNFNNAGKFIQYKWN